MNYTEEPKRVKPKERWDSIEQCLKYLRHLAAYLFAEKFVSNRSLLEIGCGTGCGANLLSKFASHTVAIDISKERISYCHYKYEKENSTFLVTDGLRLPFRDQTFDAAISFQVIEHIDPKLHLDYLSEVKRVLKRKGTFIVTTPNSKQGYFPFKSLGILNIKKESHFKGFKNLLSRGFEEVKVYGLRGSEENQYIERN